MECNGANRTVSVSEFSRAEPRLRSSKTDDADWDCWVQHPLWLSIHHAAGIVQAASGRAWIQAMTTFPGSHVGRRCGR